MNEESRQTSANHGKYSYVWWTRNPCNNKIGVSNFAPNPRICFQRTISVIFWKTHIFIVRAPISFLMSFCPSVLKKKAAYARKGKAVSLQAWTGPEGSRKFSDFVTTAKNGGRLSALRTGRLYPQETLLVHISLRGWVDPRAIVGSEGFYVTEISNDTSWDRTSDLPICSTAP